MNKKLANIKLSGEYLTYFMVWVVAHLEQKCSFPFTNENEGVSNEIDKISISKLSAP